VHIAAKYARLRLSYTDVSTGLELLGLLGLLAVQDSVPQVRVIFSLQGKHQTEPLLPLAGKAPIETPKTATTL
jgi:hypothetical protein